MNAYLLLENYFIRLITYQMEGVAILTNVWNDDPGDPNHATSRTYLNSTFKTQLKAEVAQYLQTVNYLAVNLADYRNNTNYINDMSAYGAGLAQDNIYYNIIARSRFICATLMNAYENDFGLYGSIVTPYDYSPGTNTPVTSVTLQFSGPSSFTTQIKAQNIKSQFPYTKWNTATAHATPDNNWSFYDFSTFQNPNTQNYLDPNIPGGTYNVTLVDNGNTDNPWRHQSTNLGTVSVKYYDPNNLNNPTTSPTQTNTIKFGSFSGRWNWGFSRINSSYFNVWVVPSKNTVTVTSDPSIPPYYPSVSVTWPNPTLNNLGNGATYSPISSTSGIINQFSMFMPNNSNNARTLAYTVQLPIIMDAAPGDGTTASAKLYYDNSASGTFSASESKASTTFYYNMGLVDSTTNKSTYMAQYNSSTHNINFTNQLYQGILDPNITVGRTYNVDINSCLYCEPYKSSSSTGNINMSWYMQIVYSNNYNIFQ
jgi:hypothetical protein